MTEAHNMQTWNLDKMMLAYSLQATELTKGEISYEPLEYPKIQQLKIPCR